MAPVDSQDLLRMVAEGAHTSLRGLKVREESGMTSTVSNKSETINHAPAAYHRPSKPSVYNISIVVCQQLRYLEHPNPVLVWVAGDWRITRREDKS